MLNDLNAYNILYYIFQFAKKTLTLQSNKNYWFLLISAFI